MPITKQAIKKMRSDRLRSFRNKKIRQAVHDTVKLTRTSPTAKNLSTSFKVLDKATKQHIIHPNKAARLKRRLGKFV